METFTKGKKVTCPRSWANANLLTDFSVHYATPEEIQSNGGVCRKCRKQIQKRVKAILRGKKETPAVFEHHRAPDAEQDHVAFDAPGHAETVEWFNHDDVDAALGLIDAAPADARQQAGEVLRQVFQFCFNSPRKKFGARELKTAAMRFALIASSLRPEVLNDATHGELARRIGRTKAAASKAIVNFEDKFNLQLARCRSQESRERMAAAAIGHAPTNTKRIGGVCQGGHKDFL
jgi:hypothetical protein